MVSFQASVFSSVGKKTPVFVRFSTVGGEAGSADTVRDPRGFAVKFYTEEGNWDLVSTISNEVSRISRSSPLQTSVDQYWSAAWFLKFLG